MQRTKSVFFTATICGLLSFSAIAADIGQIQKPAFGAGQDSCDHLNQVILEGGSTKYMDHWTWGFLSAKSDEMTDRGLVIEPQLAIAFVRDFCDKNHNKTILDATNGFIDAMVVIDQKNKQRAAARAAKKKLMSENTSQVQASNAKPDVR